MEYCITRPDAPKPKADYDFIRTRQPIAFVNQDEGGPKVFDSVDEAVAAASQWKTEHGPAETLQIRQYMGKSKNVMEIASWGTYQCGLEVLETL